MESGNPSEVFLGTNEEIEFIKKQLSERRTINQRHNDSLPVKGAINLDNYLSLISNNAENTFEKLCSIATCALASHGNIDLIPRDRFFVAINGPNPTGFHSRNGRGYNYYDKNGFANVFAHNDDTDNIVQIIELFRSYLHDTIHESTYRTFRVRDNYKNLKDTRSSGVYREQYGINFRKPNSSYSLPDLRLSAPKLINLNRLMDGVTVLLTQKVMSFPLSQYKWNIGNVDEELWKDLNLEFPFLSKSRTAAFHRTVTEPTISFVNYWGGDVFFSIILRAMFTGKMKELASYWKNCSGLNWSDCFRQTAYK